MAPLPTQSEAYAIWRERGFQKGKTRLELKVEERPLTKVDEKAFKVEIWKRDRSHCRRCKRKVLKTMGRVPERGEVHHIHGRTGDLRFEARAALLLCAVDHERVTGRVNERLAIVPTRTFVMNGRTYADARYPVKFVKVV